MLEDFMCWSKYIYNNLGLLLTEFISYYEIAKAVAKCAGCSLGLLYINDTVVLPIYKFVLFIVFCW